MESFKEWKLKQLLVPEVALAILRQLVERKIKQEKLKKKLIRRGIVFLLFFIVGFAYMIVVWYTVTIRDFINNPSIWIVSILVSASYLHFYLTKKSFEEAEEEYEELRIDVINRSIELWATKEQWEKRHHVFEFMKEQFDINLFYK